MSGEQTGAELASEVRALVERELARIGTRAALRIDKERDCLVLGHGPNERRVEIRGTLTQWESLPDDLRVRRVQQIAALLAEDSPAPGLLRSPGPLPQPAQPAQPARPARPRSRAVGLRWYTVFAPLAIAATTAGAIAVAYRYLAPHDGASWIFGAGPAPSGSVALAGASDPDHERFALASSACEHTRTRVAQGANIGPADSEGWVVELVLLRRGAPVDLSLAPALAKFVTRKYPEPTGTLIWPAATHLFELHRFDAQVRVSATEPLGAEQISGLDLVFSGPYVLPYFVDEQRADYVRLAEALAEELGATDGALFAHCADRDSHHIGSWFLGATPGAAVASLVYFMASYSDVPLLKPNVLGVLSGPPQRGHTFDAIHAAAASIDKGSAATIVGRELGVVSSSRQRATRLTFPFRDANRATRASVIAARALKLANSG